MCYSVSFVRYSRSGRSVCPKFLCRLRGSPQKLGSNLGPISPKHCQKPRSKKYADPRQINEIANQNLTTNQLISLNAINKGDTVGTPVTKKDVRFIANTPVATTVLNSPFGNVARNSLRDARTNTGNFSLSKDFKIKERLNVVFHTTMTNVFNHPNFGSVVGEGGIDPFIDDAGLRPERTGFADQTLQDGGIRSIRFGLTFKF